MRNPAHIHRKPNKACRIPRAVLADDLGRGLSYSEIGRRHGYTPSTISIRCKSLGLPPPVRHQKKLAGADEAIRAGLERPTVSIEQIAERLGVSPTAVRNRAAILGLPTSRRERMRRWEQRHGSAPWHPEDAYDASILSREEASS